jgi:hypothetical protein
MQSLQHNVCQFPAQPIVADRQQHAADILTFPYQPKPPTGLHPAACVLLFLVVSAAMWSTGFYLVRLLCGF